MATKKIIAIAGATGAQGGGLARSILAEPDGEFAVRAITRDPSSAAARALAAAGAEVVVANLAEPDSVRKAFEGAYGAFCVTFFWHHMSPDTERAEARALADAARAARLQHVIWSTLEDTRRWVPLSDARMPTLQEHYKVPHFDVKGEADEYFRASGVPTTYLLTSFYWDNLIHFGMGPKTGPDGKLVFALPMGDRALPGIAADDIGRCAHGIFKRGQEFTGRYVGIAGEHLTGAQMAAALSKALGREIPYQAMPFETFRRLGFPGADDLGNMFQFNHDFADSFCAARSLDVSRSLNPQLQTFAQWLDRHAREIPLG
ncbi:MAG TPA: NmrA family NAD(P)-binding protein [Steroidobacteraceae bacterium]|nr:NmrA family NAD(P)-binding protein [Steroidobacteraceae bacterium]